MKEESVRSVETPNASVMMMTRYVNHTNNATTDTFFLAGNEDLSQPAEDSQSSSIPQCSL
jgi:hypothetical protein